MHNDKRATVTVAIITYERADMLARALDALARQTDLPEAVRIIDSSKEEFPRERFPIALAGRIAYSHLGERTIAPIGRNISLNETKTDIIAYLDDDSIARPSYVSSIREAFLSDEKIGCATGPTIDSTPELVPLARIVHGRFRKGVLYPWGEVRSNDRRWVPKKPVYCFGARGANMAFRTSALKAVGGFDENYPLPSFREETDPQVRLLRAGWKTLYHPGIYVNHIPTRAGGISDYESRQSDYFYRAGMNQRYFTDKYFSKFLSRASWVLWSRTPPSWIIAWLRTRIEGTDYMAWQRGLWKNGPRA